ncbi:hypothetical protein COK_0587 [Mannheimia haemolytica serotype A2 str. BOVINE]|nr:hypothetical protein COK_0587 [Mannheimia haemolytica serotype A2 str. BOVINE]
MSTNFITQAESAFLFNCLYVLSVYAKDFESAASTDFATLA